MKNKSVLLLLFVCCFCFGYNVVSLCSLAWPETHYADEAGLELTEFYLPCLMNGEMKSIHYYAAEKNKLSIKQKV